uniref:SCA7 domain-containing protein n=1 Tax=Periophthalmus magnuspinnatus TaxID=409849 RepID=A0A3B3Z9L5_9GOBI
MATVAERRSLPSPEIMLGQPWSNWVDAAKLHGNDGEFPNAPIERVVAIPNMPIFGQCPAQDDFYLVMCNHCSQVVKPQAFQMCFCPPSPIHTYTSVSYHGFVTGSLFLTLGFLLAAFFISLTLCSSLTPAVKVEKMHLNVDSSAKLVPTLSAPTTTSSSSTSSSSTTVSSSTTPITTTSSSALKPGLNCPSIPKPPLPAPGQIPNGKGHLAILSDKKQDSSSASSRRHFNKKVTEREFNPDIHCGVMDLSARKPCTRSLTCKTHSLSQRRAVPGRRKRFDTLLAEHKSRAREREREREKEKELHQPHSQQSAPLRESHPASHAPSAHDPHQNSSSAVLTAVFELKLGVWDMPKNCITMFLEPVPKLSARLYLQYLTLFRLNSGHGGGTPGDPTSVHDLSHHPQTTPDVFSRPSSDEGENEEREENVDKFDCHYSGYHPRPAAFCTFGSRLYGRGCFSFDRRWDTVRCALTTMMDKHVNSQMWKKIPFALENSSSVAPTHRASTNYHSSTPSSGFLGPPAPLPQSPYSQSYEGKSVLSYGTTLNARSSPQGGAEHPAYGTTQARQVSSSPQMPSAHSSSSSAPHLTSGRSLKSRSSSSNTTRSASFRPKDIPSGSTAPVTPNPTGGGSSGANSNSSSTNLSSGKKRKNSSLLTSSHGSSESSSNANYSSSFKKNCANVGSSGSTFHHSSLGPSASSSHTGVHSVGLNCGPTVRTNSLSLKADASMGSTGGSSGPPSSSSEHHTSFSHHSDARLEGKKRKSSPASSSVNSGGLGGGGGAGPGRPKMSKSPAINNIHGKHGRSIPGTPGLPNNSHQVSIFAFDI